LSKFKIKEEVIVRKMSDEEILRIEEKYWPNDHSENWFLNIKDLIGNVIIIHPQESRNGGFIYTVKDFGYAIPEEMLKKRSSRIFLEGLE